MQLLVAAEDKLRQAENVTDYQLKECSVSLAAQEARQPSGTIDSRWDGKLSFSNLCFLSVSYLLSAPGCTR